MTTIDVLIPAYNAGRWLRASVDSIRAQGHADLRIHVVDDGSTDATPALLAELAAADPRITVHRKANGGIVEALNLGLAQGEAEFVARHDADDIAAPDRLQRQLAYLQSHADCVAVGAVARHIDADGRALGTLTVLRPPAAADARWVPAREPYLMHPLLLARRAAIAAVGGYRRAVHAEDSDLYWRLAAVGRLHNLPHVLADYRLHGASVSGASVHGGRLMAVGSQLAALAERRRRAGLPGLPFDLERESRLRAAASFGAMLDAAGADLVHDGERVAFARAAAAKLLELAGYQPYELEADDCRVVGLALAAGTASPLPRGNRRELSALIARTAARLWRRGRRDDALALLPVRLLPQFALRCAWSAARRMEVSA